MCLLTLSYTLSQEAQKKTVQCIDSFIHGALLIFRHLACDNLLNAARRKNFYNNGFPIVKLFQEFLLHLLVFIRGLTLVDETWQVQVILRGSIFKQKTYFARVRIGVQKLVLRVFHKGDTQIVGRWTQIFVLFTREDVQGHDMRLGVTMLTSFRRRDLCALAWVAFDHQIRTFPDLASLHGVSIGSSCISGFESLPLVTHVCCFSTKNLQGANSPM